jgi:hypothetical protein
MPHASCWQRPQVHRFSVGAFCHTELPVKKSQFFFILFRPLFQVVFSQSHVLSDVLALLSIVVVLN